jgi:hypothetical protein
MTITTTQHKTSGDGEMKTSYVLVFLIVLNLFAHFIPFERASVGSDDYALLYKVHAMTYPQIMAETVTDRYLSYKLLLAMEKFVNGDGMVGLILVFVSTALVLVCVYFLLRLLLKDSGAALAGALVFSLMPNILELYHVPILVYVNLTDALYFSVLILAILYAQRGRGVFLALSLFAYTLALFSYESGFGMSAVVAAYFYLYRRDLLPKSLYYVVAAAAFLSFRFTGFGMANVGVMQEHTPSLSVLPTNILEFIHQYVGRYMVRNILYGAYKFISVEWPWLAVMVVADVALALAVFRRLAKWRLVLPDRRLLYLSAVMVIALVSPLLTNGKGGLGGRMLVLPSVGVAILLIWLTVRTGLARPAVAGLLVFFALIVCQGNSWAQVVACRLNAAVYDTIKEKKEDIAKADIVVIDTRSFADNIPFTWINRDFNVLNSYYGAPAFEDWGLSAMVRLVTGDSSRRIYISTERPSFSGGVLKVMVSSYAGYRKVVKEAVDLSAADTIVIDYRTVFGDNFNNGKRIKTP